MTNDKHYNHELVDFCQKLTTNIKTLNQTNHTTQFNIKPQPQTIKLSLCSSQINEKMLHLWRNDNIQIHYHP